MFVCATWQTTTRFILKALGHLNKYLFQYKYLIALGIVFTIASNILSIMPARLIKAAFALIQEGVAHYQTLTDKNLKATAYNELMYNLLTYSGLTFTIAVLRGGVVFLTRQTILIIGKRIEYALKNEIYAHYQTLPLSFYKRNRTGDLMARISEDVNHVGMYLGPAIMYGISTAVTFLMLIPYMLTINARLTLYAVFPILCIAIGNYYIGTFIQERAAAIQHSLSKITFFVQESFTGIKVIQAFNQATTFTQNFAEACAAYKAQARYLTAIHAIFFPVTKSIISLGTILVVFMGGKAIIRGDNTFGNIAEFIFYLNLLGWPTFATSWLSSIVQRAAASQKRINAFLQEKNPILSRKGLKRAIQGHIAFKNVSFAYPNANTDTLHAINFEIPAGQSVAIIGATGVGKSAIAHLINRLYDANTGEIMIDGIPIQDYAIPCLRQQLGYVPQDVFLFADTIRNNIAWGKPDATDAEIIESARQTEIYAHIQKLPQQLATVSGERGTTLSGGQKQRIAIARALIRTPKILILDDCFSAIDTQTSSNILRNITHAIQKRTMILITHSVSSARMADHIITLEAGKIAEQGTHSDLLSYQGPYYALYRQQHMI